MIAVPRDQVIMAVVRPKEMVRKERGIGGAWLVRA